MTIDSIKEFEINIKEVKLANYKIKANTVKEAKELAYWRLHTQTNPSVESEVFYEVN